jgi:hypothetical protein
VDEREKAERRKRKISRVRRREKVVKNSVAMQY